ncbi:hypothetical protein M431DRAFT_503256 [Trichoderma harzianum CBS 226.95]|uniref:Uncharacterized protein n=1 Tax=Trichoderma harzianum CBS 226.95 TaxID=983964 RepID=A0A2T4AVK5_TRIHA|nr:hypothetical protein M431DRAFT_503256 [Trichoderma harzianum CBS 226.95]PTB61104.1 hypothetical protein M431DRAFT_503256 [Trichoderma harzianum CBS 226.95]
MDLRWAGFIMGWAGRTHPLFLTPNSPAVTGGCVFPSALPPAAACDLYRYLAPRYPSKSLSVLVHPHPCDPFAVMTSVTQNIQTPTVRTLSFRSEHHIASGQVGSGSGSGIEQTGCCSALSIRHIERASPSPSPPPPSSFRFPRHAPSRYPS